MKDLKISTKLASAVLGNRIQAGGYKWKYQMNSED